jgi:hypothetical protein
MEGLESDPVAEAGRLSSVLVPSRLFNAEKLDEQARADIDVAVEKYVWEVLLLVIVPTVAVNGPLYGWYTYTTEYFKSCSTRLPKTKILRPTHN